MRLEARRTEAWDGHLALIHDSEQQRRAGVADWVRRGFDLGAKILYVEPPDEPAERTFLAVLAAEGIDAGPAVDEGQVEVVMASPATYQPGWLAARCEQALDEGYSNVRLGGESDTAWHLVPPVEHADTEWATDALCRSGEVSILCQYPARLPETTLQSVCAMHGNGCRDSLLATWPVPGGVALAGEVDASNERMLRMALAAASARRAHSGGTLVLDLSRLTFLGSAGARALLTGTTRHRLSGGTVSLLAPTRAVEQVVRLLGVNQSEVFSLEASS